MSNDIACISWPPVPHLSLIIYLYNCPQDIPRDIIFKTLSLLHTVCIAFTFAVPCLMEIMLLLHLLRNTTDPPDHTHLRPCHRWITIYLCDDTSTYFSTNMDSIYFRLGWRRDRGETGGCWEAEWVWTSEARQHRHDCRLRWQLHGTRVSWRVWWSRCWQGRWSLCQVMGKRRRWMSFIWLKNKCYK